MPTVKPIPDGYTAVTPYLLAEDAAKLVEFIKNAFGAKVEFESRNPAGGVMHAEVSIDGARIMIGGTRPGVNAVPGMIYLYVADTDANYNNALKAGATTLMAPANQFYGDRNAGVKDLAGNQWYIATHVEDVAPDEVNRRAQEMYKKAATQHG